VVSIPAGGRVLTDQDDLVVRGDRHGVDLDGRQGPERVGGRREAVRAEGRVGGQAGREAERLEIAAAGVEVTGQRDVAVGLEREADHARIRAE
jgi:hypothetical protein